MMALELEAVNLKSLLSNSLSIVRDKETGAQRIGFWSLFEVGDDLGVPQLDMRKTKQIVYNLLSNAVKFSAAGGKVTLRARSVLRSSVGSLPGNWSVHTFPLAEGPHAHFLEITVTDGGIGISPTDMTKLFLPFSQIDSSLARKFEGTGLGLAMVKLMAELHGGTVAVASAVGEGTTFAVWLPVVEGATQAAVLPNAAQAPLAVTPVEDRTLSALVIEDDDPAAELVRLLLESEGFNVVRAASAEKTRWCGYTREVSTTSSRWTSPCRAWTAGNSWNVMRGSVDLMHVPVVIISGVDGGNTWRSCVELPPSCRSRSAARS